MKKKKRVLVVDDALLSRRLITRTLTDEYVVLEAVDGKQALDILEKFGNAIDMVVTDIVMPEMDGFELLEAIKKNEKIAHLPVVIVTSMGDLESELRALSLGAIDVMVKPIHTGVTRQRIKNILYMSDLEQIQAENRVLKIYQDMKIQLQAILDSSVGGILRVQYGKEVYMDLGEMIYANDAFFQLRGIIKEEQMNFHEQGYLQPFMNQEDFEQIHRRIRETIVRGGSQVEGDVRVQRPDGTVRYLHSIAAITYVAGGYILDVIEMDITERKEVEGRLRENQAFLENFVNQALPHTRIRVWKYDIKKRTIMSTAVDDKIRGFFLENVPDTMIAKGYVHPGSVEAVKGMYQRLETGEKIVEGTFLLHRSHHLVHANLAGDQEDYGWEHITYTTIFDNKGNPESAIGISENVTEQVEVKKKYEQEIYHSKLLRKLAEHDAMTGLLNRATFEQIVGQILALEGKDTIVAMLMIDADNFKLINDTFGHDYGDQVLATVARRLENCFLVDGIVARIGGDEFSVFMEDIKSEEYLYQKLRSVCDQLNFQFDGEEGKTMISGSIGVVIAPKNSIDFKQLYGKADKALYQAKAQGKNRFVLYK